MRGESMTRIEVFVDAAFAFAVTMLVISLDSIPRSYDELVLAMKSIPAFTVSVIQLAWLWHVHSEWSRRYGLDDSRTVTLSVAMLIVVLIYIYPLRILFAGMFTWLSGGYFPPAFNESMEISQLSNLFIFFGIGFVVICLIYVLMYRHAIARKEYLRLSKLELYDTQTRIYAWLGSACIGLLSILLALILQNQWLPFSGFAYALLSFWLPRIHLRRAKNRPPVDLEPA
jgi:uncharacterized membrane protein